MFKGINFTQLGGLYVTQATLDFLQTAYGSVLDGLANAYGDLVIVDGLIVNGNTVSDGWIVYNKQLYPVVGGSIQQYLFEDVIGQNEQFADGGFKPVYTTKRFVFTNMNTGIEWTDLKRLPFATTSLLDAFTTVQNLFSKMAFDEPVILSGCAIEKSDENNSTVQIAPGVVFINGKLLSVPPYSGSYDVYINSEGAFTDTQPNGPSIKFNYDTSQRYADVIRRNTSHTGQVFTHTNIDELKYFEADGTGKWRWQGFKISELLQSRVPIGYDVRTSAPITGADTVAWDASNRIVGNSIGKNKHKLTKQEVPLYDLIFEKPLPYRDDSGIVADNFTNQDNKKSKTLTKVSSGGGDLEHENRQPSRVVLQIERM